MSEELVIAAVRFGALLGLGMGIVLALVVSEVAGAFREWRQFLEHRRQIRCMRDWK